MNAGCQWSDAFQIIVRPGRASIDNGNIVTVGSTVILKSDNNLRALCAYDFSFCAGWSTVEGSNVSVQAPATPVPPTVVINAPSTIGGCDDALLDLGSSLGSGGRDWQSMRFSVSTANWFSSAVAVEDFLNQNYSISPLREVPSNLLRMGEVYDLTAELCNFLGSCGYARTTLRVLNSTSAVPVVSIPGSPSRTIKRSTELKLTASAYVKSCSGKTRTSGLLFRWQVLQRVPSTGELALQEDSVSISKDPSKFTLPPFSVEVDSTYVVGVVVSDASSLTNSSASISVVVPRSRVVAAVAGTLTRTVRFGDSLTIDASDSFDEDVESLRGASAGLTFVWRCVGIIPPTKSCPLTFKSGLAGESSVLDQLVLYSGEGSENTTSLVSLLVLGEGGRNDSVEVVVRTLNKDAPLVTITTSATLVDTVNVNRKLLISGTVETFYPCSADWIVDDPSLDLRTVSLVPTSASASEKFTRTTNLYLASQALQVRSTYVFSLLCDGSTASITVTTNGPPEGGQFSVTPSSGMELSTAFVFSTSQWSDPHLPISFQFGLISTSVGGNLALRGRSEQSYMSSNLPAGVSYSEFAVNCSVIVFDSLDASTRSYQSVTVSPVLSDALPGLIETQLSGLDERSVDDVKQTLAILSSILNRVDCNGSPDCLSLNRANCSAVSQTCGSCLPGYYGESAGAANSACVLNTEANSFRSLAVSPTNKQCIGNCSFRGNCVFFDISTGLELESCTLWEWDCEAVCECNVGYGGSSCSQTQVQWEEEQRQRLTMLSGLQSVASNDDLTEENVETWVSGLVSLVRTRHDLANDSLVVMREVTDAILTNAADVEYLSYEETTGLLGPLDAWADRVSENETITGGEGNKKDGSEVLRLLMKFERLVTRELVAEQDPAVSIYKNFRIASVVFGEDDPDAEVDMYLPSPTTGLEQLSGEESGVSIGRNATLPEFSSVVKLSTIETAARVLSGGGGQFLSNSVRVSVSGASAVEITLKNNAARDYKDSYASWNFTSSCSGPADFSVSNYTCPQSGVVLTHRCRGVAGSNTSFCPVPATTCNQLNLTSAADVGVETGVCVLLNYTEVSTTCSCPIRGIVNTRRLQDAEEESGVADFVTMATYVSNDFSGTFSVAQDFSSPVAFERALIVILMFVVLWVGGFGLIFGCAMRQKMLQQSVIQSNLKLQQRQRRVRQFGSQVSVFEMLSRYVEEVFPVVFGHKNYLHRMTEEIKKHHGYLTLITAPPGESGNKTRVLTGCYLLTMQSMLMFLLGVFYDLQGPDDDGSCEPLTTEEACLERKTMLDNDQTYCQWTQPTTAQYPCSYQPPYITPLIAVYIAVFVSVITALLMYPIDRVFDLLSAPMADEEKVQAADSVLKQIGRRVSNVGQQVGSVARRMSAVAANVGTSVVRNFRQSGKLKAGMPTRDFPDSTMSAHLLAQASIQIIESRAHQNLLDHRRYSSESRRSVFTGGRRSLVRGLDQPIRRRDSEESDSSSNSGSELDSFGDSLSEDSLDEVDGDESKSSSTTCSDREQKGEEKTKRDGDALLAHKPILGTNIPDLFVELQDEIHHQRRLLKSSELDEFDFAWGLDPTGEFVRDEKFMGGRLRVKAGAATNITRELEHVKRETSRKVEKLSLATDVHTGLEILHLFVLDLLGRDTPAALIFETKSAEDFKHTTVITQKSKILAWLFVFLMNLFFSVYSVLKGYQKGVEWQRNYLLGCIVQLVIEIFLFETLECVWIHFFVPSLVASEVQRVNDLLMDTVNQLCSLTPPDSRYFLNAPDYLFVSTNVAKCFPDLVESIIVRSFHHHLPGELAKKWHLGTNLRISRLNRVHRFAPIATALTVLQSLATAPFAVQRVIIRFLQPFLLTGLIVMWLYIATSPALIAVFSFLCVAGFCFLTHLYYKEGRKRKISKVFQDPDDCIKKDDGEVENDAAEDLHSPSLTPLTLSPPPTSALYPAGEVRAFENESSSSESGHSSVLSTAHKLPLKHEMEQLSILDFPNISDESMTSSGISYQVPKEELNSEPAGPSYRPRQLPDRISTKKNLDALSPEPTAASLKSVRVELSVAELSASSSDSSGKGQQQEVRGAESLLSISSDSDSSSSDYGQ